VAGCKIVITHPATEGDPVNPVKFIGFRIPVYSSLGVFVPTALKTFYIFNVF
jgi:hypothetical protein